MPKYMSMKHANSLTMLEQDVLKALLVSAGNTSAGQLEKACKASPERIKRAISYLVWRKLIKGKRQ